MENSFGTGGLFRGPGGDRNPPKSMDLMPPQVQLEELNIVALAAAESTEKAEGG
ncbi:MAG: hypothetical protein IKE69_12215 [Thermoguttaceae bacterium]|nr:hypothetical protein [Thermoguttaceae bacterium]